MYKVDILSFGAGVGVMCLAAFLMNRTKGPNRTDTVHSDSHKAIKSSVVKSTCIIKIGGSACTIKDSV